MTASEQPRTLHEVVMDVRYSARYHMMIERWYLMLNDVTTFTGLLLFSSVVLSILKQVEWIAVLAAAIGALLQAANLTFGSVRKAQAHRDLYKQYQELDSKLSSNAMELSHAEEAYRRIEMQDPAINARFARLAYLENLRTHGYANESIRAESALTPIDRFLRSTLG